MWGKQENGALAGLLVLAIGAQSPALAQDSGGVSLADAALQEVGCTARDNVGADVLVDGDPASAWIAEQQHGPCFFTYLFSEPVAVESLTLTPPWGKNLGAVAPAFSVWGSHQEEGLGFYLMARQALVQEAPARVTFDEPILMRRLHIALETSEPFSAARLHGGLGEITVQFGDASTADRWPRPFPAHWPQRWPGESADQADPILRGQETECDVLAAGPSNPDSYGFGLLTSDIDLSAALPACVQALADQPNSRRIAYQMARLEVLSERYADAVARLGGNLLRRYPPAMEMLADLVDEGRGITQDADRATALRERSAEADFGPALTDLARVHEAAVEAALLEDEVLEGAGEVHPALQRALDIGHLPAWSLYEDFVLRTDSSQLLSLMPQLEEVTMYGSFDELSQPLWNDHHGIPRDQERAAYWTARYIAEDPGFVVNQAIMLNNLRGDLERSARLARRASYGGDPFSIEIFAHYGAAQNRVRVMAMRFAIALELAEGGDQDAMFVAAEALINGTGVEQNREEGGRWMRLAAAAGEPRALHYVSRNAWVRDQ
ncbi:MAG: hypothetical protein ACFB01_05445 [Cohaesibacteraceae bacterium]